MDFVDFLVYLTRFNIFEILDVVFMALLIYLTLVWFKKTKAAFVVIGIFFIGGFYLLARVFNMNLITTVFQGFFTIILIASVIIFQEEIRYFFERVAVWGLKLKIKKRKGSFTTRKEVDVLIRTLFDLAKEKIGALVVIRGKDMIMRHLDGGIALNGDLSEPILKSLFDPHSIGHDGAILVENNKIVQFSAHLPLSKDLEKLGKGGTRHAAALGLVERSDAMCLVVSEERGVVSCAQQGEINPVNTPEELRSIVDKFFSEISPTKKLSWADIFKSNFKEKILAVVLALLLWFVLDYGSTTIYKTYTAPIKLNNLSKELVINELSPDKVTATFFGQRRNFYLFPIQNIHVAVDASRFNSGKRKLRLYGPELNYPKELNLNQMTPNEIQLEIGKKEPTN